jgi:ABC-type transport system involved in multi-copper enzyme maturation permease subunit
MQKGLVPWAKAGVIITGSTKQGAAYAAIMLTGSHGVHMQYNYTHDTAGQPGSVSSASPRWLRLTRSGGTLTGYESVDGTHWSKIGTASLAGLPATVQAGLFVTSPAYRMSTSTFGGGSSESGPSIATAVFDHVSLQASTASAWTGTDIGASSSQLPASTSGFSDTGGRFTVTGSGDIAPIAPGAAGFPSVTIEQHLVGAFAALIAVIIIAAMFITAEFRRGLIRITFTASPRRGQVLAAKAIVIGLVSFMAGLVAAVIALALGNHLARDGGYYVFPVSPFTEARVIVGTAALISIAAILTIAVGTLLRRSAATVTAAIVAIVLPYILAAASVLPANAAQWLLRLTPAAGFAIQQSIPQYPQVSASYSPASGFFPLSPWTGIAVLCGYAAIVLALAFVLLRRRDA